MPNPVALSQNLPIILTCPYCSERVVMSVGWWTNGHGDAWATGQSPFHACAPTAAIRPTQDSPLW